MAVKQNNTEANGSAADANQGNGGSGANSTGTITKSKKMIANGTNVDNGSTSLSAGVSLGAGGSTELPGCSGTGASSNTKFISSASSIGPSADNLSADQGDISKILKIIFNIEKKQQQVDLSADMPVYHNFIIKLLSCVPFPGQIGDFNRFKEDMFTVELFFDKTTEEKEKLLLQVCQYITRGEKASCTLAVIFQLFKTKLIIEAAVQSLLDQNVNDQNIRKTVCLLCEWLRFCNFCSNLHIWIQVILSGLQERNKYALVEQIALENIENLFTCFILPNVRPRVAPVVFYMLSSIDQKPALFHKIIPRFTYVINILKHHSNSTEEITKILHQLVDLTRQLMSRFNRYDDLYGPIELALKGFQRSNNYMNYVYSSKPFNSSAQNANAKVGLVNLGNTCYMNSVLQALAMTKEFSRGILLSESKSPLLIKMQQQIAFMLYSTRQELTPSKVLNATRPPGFSPGLQQDSSEFLGYLLETLHEQEVSFRKKTLKPLQHYSEKETSNKIMNNVENRRENCASALCNDEDDNDEGEGEGEVGGTTNHNISITDAVDSIKSTKLQVSNKALFSSSSSIPSTNTITTLTAVSKNSEISTIENTFTGKLATTYKCLTCGSTSCNIDSFRDLQLSFPDVKNDCASNYSVQDLIEYYCSSEKLYGENQYFCERCKKLSDAERYINVISAPKNLILTLKHFKYDQKYQMRAKLMHKVFHDEKVSLKVCAADNLEEIATAHYDLYAGVVHSGFSMDSGHYYTYAADATNKWYKFNDSIVTPSRTEELHNLTPPNTPYILFYQMGARSNETPETSASTKVIKVNVPTPLTLEELPNDLRNMVAHDNLAFSEELSRFQNVIGLNAGAMKTNDQRRDSYDDDDEQPPPASGCGSNAMNININRFVY